MTKDPITVSGNVNLEALVAADCDMIVVDTAHGHSIGVLRAVEPTRKAFPDLQLVGR